ncbi:MAG: response regulator [Deltaproteobacteria bacterium]|nr:response regulator [Deltaproteobacteria bacterium]
MENKKLEKEQMVEKQQIHSEEIDNLQNLIPGLVHKLNNHLASIIGYGQLLLPKVIDPVTKKDLHRIIEEARQASKVIKDLVNFATKRKPQKETEDINGLVESVLEIKIPELNNRKINLVKQLSPFLPFTQVDPKQIQEVLFYLINNAEEAISGFHGFGEIRIKTHVFKNQIEIVVSDDGPGIQKGDISKLTDPFFTTKGKGIGLGLAISNDILLAHGGTMRVESEWGKGTTFIITLPIIAGGNKREKDEGKAPERDLRGLKGLVIDDDPSILEVVSEYLERVGCKISIAEDVRTAINIIEDETFDFVICDMKMPVMGGDDFYEIIKQRKPSLKDRIIFSSGDLLGETTRVFIDSVMNPYIEKPFDLNELKEIIIQLLITKTQ